MQQEQVTNTSFPFKFIILGLSLSREALERHMFHAPSFLCVLTFRRRGVGRVESEAVTGREYLPPGPEVVTRTEQVPENTQIEFK